MMCFHTYLQKSLISFVNKDLCILKDGYSFKFHKEKIFLKWNCPVLLRGMSEITSNSLLRYLWDRDKLLGQNEPGVTMKNWTAWQQLSGSNMVSWLEAGSGIEGWLEMDLIHEYMSVAAEIRVRTAVTTTSSNLWPCISAQECMCSSNLLRKSLSLHAPMTALPSVWPLINTDHKVSFSQ